jgi:hypothetical protein
MTSDLSVIISRSLEGVKSMDFPKSDFWPSTAVSIGTVKDGVREEDLKDMKEKGRRRDWESRKDPERSWSLDQKQDSLEMLRGRPMLLKK